MDAVDLIPLNPRDYLILFALVDEDRHGYGIVKEVELGSRGRVRIDPANLYRALKRMMASGLVGEADQRPSTDAADERRRYYHLTALGRETVQLEAARLADLTAAARARDLIPDGGATA